MMILTKDVQTWNRQLETLEDFDDDAIGLEKVNHRTDLRNGSLLHPLKPCKLVASQANKLKVMDIDLVSWSNCLLTMAFTVYSFFCYAWLWDLHFILPVPSVIGDLGFHVSYLVVQHLTGHFVLWFIEILLWLEKWDSCGLVDLYIILKFDLFPKSLDFILDWAI